MDRFFIIRHDYVFIITLKICRIKLDVVVDIVIVFFSV